jgi:hypothetical protein
MICAPAVRFETAKKSKANVLFWKVIGISLFRNICQYYSCRKDSMGLKFAALLAGRYPKVMPTSAEKPNAIKIE